MKSYKVTVTYQDAQPGEGQESEKVYIVKAKDEFDAEFKAMCKNRLEFWANEPLFAVVTELKACGLCNEPGELNANGDCPDCVWFMVEEKVAKYADPMPLVGGQVVI